MTTYTLLAHKLDGSQALVQHDNEHAAYLYTFDDIQTYQLVPLDFTVDQETWETTYDHKVQVPSADHIMLIAQGKL